MYLIFDAMILLIFTGLAFFTYYFLDGNLNQLFLTLIIILLWGYSSYFHRVVLSPLTFGTGVLTGKLRLLEELKHRRKK